VKTQVEQHLERRKADEADLTERMRANGAEIAELLSTIRTRANALRSSSSSSQELPLAIQIAEAQQAKVRATTDQGCYSCFYFASLQVFEHHILNYMTYFSRLMRRVFQVFSGPVEIK
jgi:hypothetical protein